MLLLYQKKFPNARFHIVGIPPTDVVRHEETNEALDKIGKRTGTQFVSTKVFLDEHTKKIRSKTMRDKVHYNDWGVRTICKEMKKSLYSPDNKGNGKLAASNQLRGQDQVKSAQPDEADAHVATPTEVTSPTEYTEVEIVTSEMDESPEIVKFVTSEIAPETVEQQVTLKDTYDPALLAQLC